MNEIVLVPLWYLMLMPLIPPVGTLVGLVVVELTRKQDGGKGSNSGDRGGVFSETR
jgi:hypothetical protein